MRAVDVILQPRISAARSAATDRCLMRSVRRGERWAVLRVYSLAGETVSLGRYHLAPATIAVSDVSLGRRISGGRIWPHGSGFVGVSLILPHRSALLADTPFAFRPEQLMNRYVRGILAAGRLLGTDPVYPGRDVATIERRVFAAASLEVDGEGTAIFEAVIANTCDFSVLPGRLARLDEGATLMCEKWQPRQTICLSRLLAVETELEDLGEALRRGYGEQFGADFAPGGLRESECREIDLVLDDDRDDRVWLNGRVHRPELNYRAWAWGQLGVFEVHLELSADRCITDIVLAGDFIASSAAVEELEQALRGCPLDLPEIRQVVDRIWRRPKNFFLGVRPLETIAETIASVSKQ